MKIELAKTEVIHFIGIGGIGMSGLSLIMKGKGFKVQGSDISSNKNIDRLKKEKIKVFIGQKKQNLKNATIAVISSAIKKNNSDICITRAGASTLAELSLLNIPFIAVPLPNSKDNHQFENALFYKEKECCWMLNQETFEDNIEQLLTSVLSDNSEFLQKKENLKKINYKNNWTNVNQKILNIINEN